MNWNGYHQEFHMLHEKSVKFSGCSYRRLPGISGDVLIGTLDTQRRMAPAYDLFIVG